MANYKKMNVATAPRTELHDALGLTGAEISVNVFPAGAGVPFVHSHKENEEIYFVADGRGKAVIDDDAIELAKGDWIRVSPSAKRQFSATDDESVTLVCIQVKENSLEHFTAEDAVVE